MKSVRFIAAICAAVTIIQTTQPMHSVMLKKALQNNIQSRATRKIVAVISSVASAIGYNYFKHDEHFNKRNYYYVSKTDDNNPPQVHEVPTPITPSDTGKSPTRQYVNRLYAQQYPVEFMQEESTEDTDPEATYSKRIGAIVSSNYRDGIRTISQEHRQALVDGIMVFTKNEEYYGKTHHAFYHGTNDFFNMVKRTIEFEKSSGNNCSEYFFFREPGHNNALNNIDDPLQYATKSANDQYRFAYNQHIENQQKIIRPFGGGSIDIPQPHFNHESNKFLCANRTATSFSTDVHGGRNSLRFITPIIIYDGFEKVIGNILFPAWTKGIATSAFTKFGNFIDSVYRSYYELPEQESVKQEKNMDAIIQVLIPKEKCSRIFNAGGNNIPKSKYTVETLDDEAWNDFNSEKQDDTRIHAIVPLDPDIFENPSSGVIMNAIVFAEPEQITDLFKVIKDKETL